MTVCVVKRENRNEDQIKERQGKTDDTGEKERSREEDPKVKNVRKILVAVAQIYKDEEARGGGQVMAFGGHVLEALDGLRWGSRWKERKSKAM